MNCNTHFNGWDWQELATAWGIYIPESYAGKDMYKFAEEKRLATPEEKAEEAKRTYILIHDDGTEEKRLWSDMFDNVLDWSVNDYEDFNEFDPILWYITCVLKKHDGNNDTRVMKKMANDIRCFAEKLSESEFSYLVPFWKGISMIENDWTIITLISNDYPLIASMWD